MAVIRCFSILLLLGACAAFVSQGAMLNYSGRIWVDGAKFNGTGHFAFSIADTNGVISWASGDMPFEGSTNLPPNLQTLPVEDGVYQVRIGDTNAGMPELKMDALRTASPRLHVWFNDGVHGWRRVDEVALQSVLKRANESTRAPQAPEDAK